MFDFPVVDHMRDFTPEERIAAWAAVQRTLLELVHMLHDISTCSNSRLSDIDRAKKLEKEAELMRYRVMQIRFPGIGKS
jgi:hypothetical protein